MCRGRRPSVISCWSKKATRCSTTDGPSNATPAPSNSSSRAAITACAAFPNICRKSCASQAIDVHLLYEEEGESKVGTALAQAPASFQVESPHGRRSKVKAGNVLLSFEQPAPGELLAEARRFAEAVDVDFLWQCSGAAEFDFKTLARDYVGREPTP